MQVKNTRRGMQEKKLTELIERMILSDLDWFGRSVLKILRLSWNDHPVHPDRAPSEPELPKGPYTVTRPNQRGSLLLWVPRGLDSLLIDDLTGGYGYSHLSVDNGEIDQPTGRPVMIESMVGQRVQHQFLDVYGKRCYIRIPLAQAGVNVEAFSACVETKVGEQYDDLEALTWGAINDPAKEVCSDLAADCLPDNLRVDIARCRRLHLLSRFSVSVHSKPSEHGVKEFISPNGFAEYFQAPRGKNVHRPGMVVTPREVKPSVLPGVKENNLWKVAAIYAAALVLLVFILRGRRMARIHLG